MSKKNIKELIELYEYKELGFPIILRDVLIVQDRGYEYPLLNQKAIMSKAAFNLVLKHESLDGARLKFLRRFIGFSLDEMSKVTDISKSTLHKWEKEVGTPLNIPNDKLRLIFTKVRDTLSKGISEKMDEAIVKDIISPEKMSPLEIYESDVAV